MFRKLASIATLSALAITPAAVAVERGWPGYSVSVAAAPAATADSGNRSSGSTGSSERGDSTPSAPTTPSTPSMPDWGGSRTQAAPTISGTPVTSAPGVVMIETAINGGEGAGTGIVLRSNGIILTNYHVVNGSTSIRVTDNGKTYSASVIGYDQEHDIAVLKLADANNMTTAKLDTAKVVVGDAVTAIGQGGGQGVLYTTSGTITAVNQEITAQESSSGGDSETLTGLIQTNAQIVPGYSGGPLFDDDGEVTGINTAASSTTPISGYAIPISSAVAIATQIESGRESGTVRIGPRAALGVEISTAATGYGRANELVIVGVSDGGAADAAGMTAGSTITSLGGVTIGSASDLTSALGTHDPGDRVSVSWTAQDGGAHTATITLGTATTN